MRILTLFIVFLFVIQRNFAAEMCACSCCKSNGCTPESIDPYYQYNCNENSCSPNECSYRYFDRCPPIGAPGSTVAVCRDGSERVLSSLFLIFGITSIILMIKNRF
jgi:hypothetical protein